MFNHVSRRFYSVEGGKKTVAFVNMFSDFNFIFIYKKIVENSGLKLFRKRKSN